MAHSLTIYKQSVPSQGLSAAERHRPGGSDLPQEMAPSAPRPVPLLPSEWNTVIQNLRWAREEDREAPDRAYARWMQGNSHRHRMIEAVVSLRGCHLYGCDGQAVRLTPGMVQLFGQDALHDATYGPCHDACTDFWLHFSPGGYYTLNFLHHTPHFPYCSKPVQIQDERLAERLRIAGQLLYQEGRQRHRLKCERLLLYVLHEIFESIEGLDVDAQQIDKESIVDTIKNYISKHLHEPLTLRDLADAAGYSPFHFHRIFVEAEGITPRRFVEAARLKQACQLLKQGHSVTSVAFDLGFSTHAQFDRVFKKHFRCSPSSWVFRTQPG